VKTEDNDLDAELMVDEATMGDVGIAGDGKNEGAHDVADGELDTDMIRNTPVNAEQEPEVTALMGEADVQDDKASAETDHPLRTKNDGLSARPCLQPSATCSPTPPNMGVIPRQWRRSSIPWALRVSAVLSVFCHHSKHRDEWEPHGPHPTKHGRQWRKSSIR
jgi:hypothetical protein